MRQKPITSNALRSSFLIDGRRQPGATHNSLPSKWAGRLGRLRRPSGGKTKNSEPSGQTALVTLLQSDERRRPFATKYPRRSEYINQAVRPLKIHCATLGARDNADRGSRPAGLAERPARLGERNSFRAPRYCRRRQPAAVLCLCSLKVGGSARRTNGFFSLARRHLRVFRQAPGVFMEKGERDFVRASRAAGLADKADSFARGAFAKPARKSTCAPVQSDANLRRSLRSGRLIRRAASH